MNQTFQHLKASCIGKSVVDAQTTLLDTRCFSQSHKIGGGVHRDSRLQADRVNVHVNGGVITAVEVSADLAS